MFFSLFLAIAPRQRDCADALPCRERHLRRVHQPGKKVQEVVPLLYRHPAEGLGQKPGELTLLPAPLLGFFNLPSHIFRLTESRVSGGGHAFSKE